MTNEPEEANDQLRSSSENSQSQEETEQQSASTSTTSRSLREKQASVSEGIGETSSPLSPVAKVSPYDEFNELESNPELIETNVGLETDAVAEEEVSEIIVSIPQAQEKTRAVLAKSLILLLAGTIGATFLYIFVSSFMPRPVSCLPNGAQNPIIQNTNPSPAPTPGSTPTPNSPSSSDVAFCTFDNSSKELITLILNSLTTILGTALGFYFGTQAKDERNATQNKK
ncbi:hypothetical protein WKK05_30410 [Nostoc sp. UHCC 0302]|uniref:hypothetical protein n=1 Tax=Nostoc sp. UHCC 0302 TaxID=3134896 RepID=UPI00311CA888